MSLCAIFSIQGIIGYKILDGGFDRTHFFDFIENMILEGKLSSDMVLVMDNVRFHHVNEIKELLRINLIQFVYLPSYSPQFNPIENVFSVLKSKVSSFRPKAHNRNTLLNYVEKSIEEFNTNEPQFFINFYRKMWDNAYEALNN